MKHRGVDFDAEEDRPGLWRLKIYPKIEAGQKLIVAPIHPKAMPLILTTEEEHDVWMRAPWDVRQRRYSVPCRTRR